MSKNRFPIKKSPTTRFFKSILPSQHEETESMSMPLAGMDTTRPLEGTLVKSKSPARKFFNYVFPPKLPRSFWFVMVGYVINGLAIFVGPFLEVLLTKERGFSTSLAG